MQVSNRYRLIEPLGEGGMGVVWRAYDELLDRTVAIKEVRYAGVGEAKRAELNRRTIREARAAGRLDHPSVVVIHDVVEQDGRPWIVMQLVRSRSLAQVVREEGPLRPGQVAMIGGRVLDALRAAHATGVLHRDVKPENVLLADDGRVVLTDFGIASLEAEAGLTASGGLVGTPAYMPPERLNGEPARPESDLWSLGATLYAAVEGEPPFKRDSWAATVAAVLRDEPEPPARAGTLTPVIMGLLRRDPGTRMPAEEAALLLHEAAINAPGDPRQATATQGMRPAPAGGPGHPTSEAQAYPTAGERPAAVRERSRRGRTLWVTLPAVAVAAAVGTGGTLLYTSRTTPTPTPTPTAAPSTSTSGPAPTPAQTLPAGWRTFTSPAGRFSIAIPEGWRATKHPTRDSISFKGPGSPGMMIVEWTTPEVSWKSPEQAWLALEKEILAKGEFQGYTRIGITLLRYRGRAAADWEFTRIRDKQLIHVINRGFHTGDGRPFALYWDTTDARWAQDKHYFTKFARTFKSL
ncbi:serine/threonine-protein kinase [Nonomuraea turcica]|uniref:serine/threonine-protein kinase n=1 Tax=Nonomuraea sp. G32 TaxID=3067274 RepID=UPI00273AEC53|nr:serine/threonine-protein kinase [Nonomuraea sp. G32]MDP4506435.1 serine/threonine-protein kinase [Nonomuraea sp. G32]